jgi:hypothetical protein
MLSETASSYGEVWHVPGAGPITGRGFIDLIFKADGKKPNIGVLSERMIRKAGQMNPEIRDLIELIYEFEEPLVLDGNKFSSEFPLFKYTLHEAGIKRQLTGTKTSVNIIVHLLVCGQNVLVTSLNVLWQCLIIGITVI